MMASLSMARCLYQMPLIKSQEWKKGSSQTIAIEMKKSPEIDLPLMRKWGAYSTFVFQIN